jgi:ribonuclease R
MSLEKEAVLSALGQSYTDGLKTGEVLDELGISRKEQGRMRKLLETMIADGLVEKIARGTYALSAGGRRAAKKSQGVRPPKTKRARSSKGPTATRSPSTSGPPTTGPQCEGRIRVHPAGYGFVVREDAFEDVFVPAKYRGAALDGDRVRLYTWQGYKGTEGRVEEVLDRGRAKLTGVLERSGGSLFVTPDDPRIATDFGRVGIEGGPGDARLGECVVVGITQYPTDIDARLVGTVAKVIGPPDDPRTEIQKIIICADIPYEMPEEVLAQAEKVSDTLVPEDLADRIDLRDRDFLTIDPETARDFDDAVCIEDGPLGGPRVWVAVADVSHYVQPGDSLDSEALIRGVSVYLPDQVIPMLPMKLSAGICSLNPHVDRCAMVVRMDYDSDCKLQDTGFAAAVICSSDRLDYPGVAAALSGDFRGRRESYRKWETTLHRLSTLAQTLRKRRRARGTLDINIPEAKVVLDADDPLLVRDVVRSKGNEGVKVAYQLVEEFMIAANESVGNFFSSRGLDAVWRIHAPPKEQRVEELAELLSAFGIAVDVDEAATPEGMSKVLDQVNKLPAAQALSFLVLRSLTQAVYDTGNVGHFGLASKEYIHFTSPIRRYPDLLSHRLMKLQLHKEGQASGRAGRWRRPEKAHLQEMAAASSIHERRAVEAEREAVAMYRAYLMREHVGDEYRGRITGVTHFGVFVEIDEPFVEGLIKIDALGDDFFDFDPVMMQLSGRRSGYTLSLGDELEVVVLNVSVALRRIELGLVGGAEKIGASDRPDRSAKIAARTGRTTRGSARKPTRAKPEAKTKGKRNEKAKSGTSSRAKPAGRVNHRGPKSKSTSASKPGGTTKKAGKKSPTKPGKKKATAKKRRR